MVKMGANMHAWPEIKLFCTHKRVISFLEFYRICPIISAKKHDGIVYIK